MQYIHELPHIREGLDHLLKRDPVFKKAGIKLDDLTWPYMRPGFGGLVRIIIGQQVSTKAAASLWQRFADEVGEATPAKLLKLSPDDMRALGLSRQKAAYIIGLAEAVKNKSLRIDKLTDMDDAAVTEAITALKGLGPWSAQMYLMFALGRADVWPHGDLGIQEGLRHYFKLTERPLASEVLKHGERFAPHRTAAALLLWRMHG